MEIGPLMAIPRLVKLISSLGDGFVSGWTCTRGVVLETRLDCGSQFPRVVSSVYFDGTFSTRSTPFACDSVRTDIMGGEDKTMVLST